MSAQALWELKPKDKQGYALVYDPTDRSFMFWSQPCRGTPLVEDGAANQNQTDANLEVRFGQFGKSQPRQLT